MNTTSTTPPVFKTLFPLKENLHLVDSLIAKGNKLSCFTEYNALLYEGDALSTAQIKTVLCGGVTG